MFKHGLRVLILIVSTFVIVNPSSAFSCTCVATAQESTQITNKLQLIKQLAEQIQMVKNQFQMLEGLTGDMVSQISGANMQILNQFMRVQDLWKQANGLTHSADDFIDKHNQRHAEPDRAAEIKALEERERRDRENAERVKAYLEGLNINAQELENSHLARNRLMSALQSTEGQVQAIQALGGLINHTAQLVEMNGQIASGMAVMFAENDMDRREKERDIERNLEKAFDHAANIKPSGRGFTTKPRW